MDPWEIIMMDKRDELLSILLNCGYMDIDKLIDVMDMSEELIGENLLYDVIDEHGSEALGGGFNPLISYLMEEITLRLVSELDNEIENDKDRYIYVLDENWDGPYANCLDSHFQLESLDGWSSGDDRDELLKKLKLDLDWMKG